MSPRPLAFQRRKRRQRGKGVPYPAAPAPRPPGKRRRRRRFLVGRNPRRAFASKKIAMQQRAGLRPVDFIEES